MVESNDKKKVKCYIPKITSIETAVKIFYENSDIGTKEMRELFGNIGTTKIAQLKNIVRDEMKIREKEFHSAYTVNVDIAYEVWGLNIEILETKLKKLQKLGLA